MVIEMGWKKIFAVIALGALLLMMPAAMAAQPMADPMASTQYPTIGQIIKDRPEFKTINMGISKLGQSDMLNTPGEYTLFAPTDDAFKKLPLSAIMDVMKNNDKMVAIGKMHVVRGRYMTADLMNMDKVTTIDGKDLKITHSGGKVYVNGAELVKPNIKASNGVIHGIDQVLMPK